MKYCEEYAALLDPFVDGELPPEELARVRAHLETCPGCRAYVDDALAIRAAFPGAEDTEVPEGFAEGVMERVRTESRKGRRSLRRWTGTLAALAACCALVVMLRTGTGGPAMENQSFAAADYTEETALADEGAEDLAPLQEPEAPAGSEEKSNTFTTAGGEEPATGALRSAGVESESGLAAMPAPAAAPAEDAAAVDGEAALYLSTGEAGDLLDDFAPAWENAGERGYELNAEEYAALLAALDRQEELAEEVGKVYLVVVTRTSE